MFFGVAFIAGLLIHGILLSLFFEAYIGKLPRALMLIPLTAYASYYALYFYEAQQIAWREAELKASNPGLLMKFDYARQDLVTESSELLVTAYKIPLVFEKFSSKKPEEYRARRLVSEEVCRNIKQDSLFRIRFSYFDTSKSLKANGRKGQPLCVLTDPDAPTKPVVEIALTTEQSRKHLVSFTDLDYTVSYAGRVLGQFRKTSVERHGLFPFPIVGCYLGYRLESTICTVDLYKFHEEIDSTPDALLGSKPNSDPIAIMLGLAPWTFEELQLFKNWDENGAALARAGGESKRVEDTLYDSLDQLNANPKLELPFNIGYRLSINRELAVSNSQKMVDLFKLLVGPQKSEFVGRDAKLKSITEALAALPKEEFEKHVDEMIDAIGDNALMQTSLIFYVRMADFTDKFASQYKLDLNNVRDWRGVAPALAICKLGKADDELKQVLRGKFSDSINIPNQQVRDAVFLALLGVGEQSFVEEELKLHKPDHAEWLNKVLVDLKAKGGKPNNCMPSQWPATEYVAPELKGWVN